MFFILTLFFFNSSCGKQLILFKNPRMLGNATIEDIATEGSSKAIMSHHYMQIWLDEVIIIIIKYDFMLLRLSIYQMLYSYKGSNTITKSNGGNRWLLLKIISFVPNLLLSKVIKLSSTGTI